MRQVSTKTAAAVGQGFRNSREPYNRLYFFIFFGSRFQESNAPPMDSAHY